MKNSSAKIFKVIAILLCFSLIFEQTGFAQVAGQLDISGHLKAFRNSFTQDTFRPLHLRYLSYDTLNNNFRLLLDKGSLKNPKSQEVERATKELLNHFFIGITLPNDAFWVNLRPDAEDQIIDDRLAQTDVGKILLESDLQLKKDTARFTSPETPEGKEYWDKLYQKAGEIFGSENITIPTLTRPWIVPDEIIIRETQDSAYIYKATLKVMLEQDYLKDSAVYNFKDDRLKELNEYSSQLIREIILPKLTKEINSSKRYASLRQVYYSLIMAQWFKARFYNKGGLYSRIIDRRVLTGITSKEYWSKTTYFQAYQKSFKDGEYNIQEPVYNIYSQTIRSYFSGGEVFNLGRMPPMGEMARNPETGAIISSIPTAASPVVNPDIVLGVRVQSNNELGQLGDIQIEVRGINIPESDRRETERTSQVQDSTGILGAQAAHLKNLERFKRILRVLKQSEDVPFISEDATDREAIEAVIEYLYKDGKATRRYDSTNRIWTVIIKDEIKNTKVGRAIKEWVIADENGVKAINFREKGGGDSWIIVGFESELGTPEIRNSEQQKNIEHEKIEIRFRREGRNWIEAHNLTVDELGEGRKIDTEQAKQYEPSRSVKSETVKASQLSYDRLMIANLERRGRDALEKGDLQEALSVYEKLRPFRRFSTFVDRLASEISYESAKRFNEYKLDAVVVLSRPDVRRAAGLVIKKGEIEGSESAVLFNAAIYVEPKQSAGQYGYTQPIPAQGTGYGVPSALDLPLLSIHWHPCNQGRGFNEFSEPDINNQPQRWIMIIWGSEVGGIGFYARLYDKKTKENRFYRLTQEDGYPLSYKFDPISENEAKMAEDKIGEIDNILKINAQRKKKIFWETSSQTEEQYRNKSVTEIESEIRNVWNNDHFEIYDPKTDSRLSFTGYYELMNQSNSLRRADSAYVRDEFLRLQLIISAKLHGLLMARKIASIEAEQSGDSQIEDYYNIFNKEFLPNIFEDASWHAEIGAAGSSSDTVDNRLSQEEESSVASSVVSDAAIKPGGIDFRSLPIVTQAIGNLSANISSSAIHNLVSINLDEEWLAIERMTNSGISPSAERIKEFIQASCTKDSVAQDRNKIILCISDILRQEEERYCETDPMLRDILVALESLQNSQDLKNAFLGKAI